MTKTPEQMAEEWAKAWRYEEVCHFALGNLRLCEYAQNEVQRRLNCGFLAGYKAAQQWISVKDRLPEYDQLVLIWHPEFKRPFVGSRVDSDLTSPLYWWRCELDMYESEEVATHWMPLHEAPKEK